MGNKCAPWSDLTRRRKRPGSEGQLFSFSFFSIFRKEQFIEEPTIRI